MRTAEAAWRRFVGMNCLVALEPDGCGYGEAYQQVWIGAGAEAGRLVPVKLESLHACIFRGVPVS